jgi:hypothetical protein
MRRKKPDFPPTFPFFSLLSPFSLSLSPSLSKLTIRPRASVAVLSRCILSRRDGVRLLLVLLLLVPTLLLVLVLLLKMQRGGRRREGR